MSECPHCTDKTERIEYLRAKLVACEIERDKYKMIQTDDYARSIEMLNQEILKLTEEK